MICAVLPQAASEGVQLLCAVFTKCKQSRRQDLFFRDGAGASQQTNGCAFIQSYVYELCYA